MYPKKLLWWGRSDVNYSRNRIIRQLFNELGWEIVDFSPIISRFADIEAYLRAIPVVDLVWVPCFRQRDIAAARRWSKNKSIPLICDPLISAYDKQVSEKAKFSEGSKKAKKLLKWEQQRFQSADVVITDTQQHADFYHTTLGVDHGRLIVLPVSAEEALFKPQKLASNIPLTILFFGSYIRLQGPEIIAEAINLYHGPEVNWTFIGDGPLRKQVESRLKQKTSVHFIDWVPYADLPNKIAQADLCLGIFGTTQKSLRVIPNKVYQALACARPVITCLSEAYPDDLRQSTQSGLFFVPAGDANALTNMITDLVKQPQWLHQSRDFAYKSYQSHFSNSILKDRLDTLLTKLIFPK